MDGAFNLGIPNQYNLILFFSILFHANPNPIISIGCNAMFWKY